MATERVGTVVIGGGQAGLAVGYHLARRGRDFVILDAGRRVGDAWRARWDSLRLFTPACFDALPGMPFPAPRGYLPGKDEMADYLETYAARFGLPVRLGIRVDGLVRDGDRYLITAGARHWEAEHTVVATGANALPRVPEFAGQLDPAITSLHSAEYRNPGQLRDGAVLVVGAGNSGAEIALELASGHTTLLAGRHPGHVPVPLGCSAHRLMGLLTVDTWLGRWVIARAAGRGDPLVRVRPDDLVRAGVHRVSRVAGVRDGRPLLEDGRVLEVASVVWCTGFTPDYRWIGVPIPGADGEPVHHRGVVRTEPGLYFVGMRFQSSPVSHTVGGMGADGERVVKRIAAREESAGRLPEYSAVDGRHEERVTRI